MTVTKYIGFWDAIDKCPPSAKRPNGDWIYIASIISVANDNTKVTVSDFGGFENSNLLMSVSGDTIRLSSSEVFGYSIEGMGIIDEEQKSIDWTYSITDVDNNSEECVGVWSKKP